MEKEIEDSNVKASEARLNCEQIFQALPPLGSEEYLIHLQTASTAALPPEVLVRAFRQLPADSKASVETLRRLFGRRADKTWEYLGPLVAYARRHARVSEYENLFQDALTHILQILRGPRGEYAESAWNAFCRRELIDAWRERYGRRGERAYREEQFPQEDESIDYLAYVEESPPWHASVSANSVEAIEKIAKEVVDRIPDEFTRAVAKEAWFKNKRPNISGIRQSEDDDAPLMSRFVGRSRYQIMRALRHADAQLAAALIANPHLELEDDLNALLKKLKVRKTTGQASDMGEEKE